MCKGEFGGQDTAIAMPYTVPGMLLTPPIGRGVGRYRENGEHAGCYSSEAPQERPCGAGSVIQNIQVRFPKQTTRFGYYLKRHIKVDRDRHTPMSMRMLAELCGEDTNKWQEATETVRIALEARIRFWDEVKEQISHSSFQDNKARTGLR